VSPNKNVAGKSYSRGSSPRSLLSAIKQKENSKLHSSYATILVDNTPSLSINTDSLDDEIFFDPEEIEIFSMSF
jgi:hypothetical protein